VRTGGFLAFLIAVVAAAPASAVERLAATLRYPGCTTSETQWNIDCRRVIEANR